MHWYQLGSWKVCSSLSLPWLLPSLEAGGASDIVINTGEFSNPDQIPLAHTVCVDVYLNCAVVDIPGLVRFLVEGGTRMVVDISPGVDPSEIQPFLLGAGLALLCSQRGLVPLRGCVVSKEGAAIAVLGRSGSGKSTLTAALMKRGYRLITDDLLIVDPASGQISSTYPILRLWKISAKVLEISMDLMPRVRHEIEKFTLSVRETFREERVSLKSIFLLREERSAENPRLVRIQSRQAVLRLHTKIYNFQLDRMAGASQRNFMAFSRLAQDAGIFDLIRPAHRPDFGLTELADLIETAQELC